MEKRVFNEKWEIYSRKGLTGVSQTSLIGVFDMPFDAMIKEKRSSINPLASGSFPLGVYEYKKEFFVEKELENKSISFIFEGVYEHALIYINNDLCISHSYGYTGFAFDAEKYLKYGETNEIKVVVNIADGARWYSGAGIYRNVYFLVGNSTCVEPFGLKINTEYADKKEAEINVSIKIKNRGFKSKETIIALINIYNEDNVLVKSAKSPITVSKNNVALYKQRLYIQNPLLWNVEDTHLYTCEVLLLDTQGNTLEVSKEQFGIRTLKLDPVNGLRINGKEVKIAGAGIHHENGPVGAVSTDFIEERRIKKLKEAGFNGIRTAHNPASEALLRACDKYGMIVLQEAFDVWTNSKVPFDHTLDFERTWKQDISEMVDASYNHPSVILYSIGNEIADTGSALGSERAREIANHLRSLDNTRFILSAVNGMVSVMGIIEKMANDSRKMQEKTVESQGGQDAINGMMFNLADTMKSIMTLDAVTYATEESFAAFDLAGYNYMDIRYENDGKLFPNRCICGTETFIPDIALTWDRVKKCPYVIGDYCWTGWDYLGEPSTGLVKYQIYPTDLGMAMPFPALTSHVGEFSVSGYREVSSYWHEIVLGKRKKPFIGIYKPENYNKKPFPTPWSFADVIDSYSFDNKYENEPLKVDVYSNSEEVRLYQNGTFIGSGKPNLENKFTITFDLRYKLGNLKAVNVRNGKEEEQYIVYSASNINQINASPEEKEYRASDYIYIPISIGDENNIVHTHAKNKIKASVKGNAYVVGFINDDPCPNEDICDLERSLYDGKCLLVIKPTDKGIVEVLLNSDNGIEKCFSIKVS